MKLSNVHNGKYGLTLEARELFNQIVYISCRNEVIGTAGSTHLLASLRNLERLLLLPRAQCRPINEI